MNEFYVYVYFDPRKEILEPFYVGKGTRNRSKSHLKKAKLKRAQDHPKIALIQKIWKQGCEPIIKSIPCMDENEAFELEEFLVEEIGSNFIPHIKDDPRYLSGELKGVAFGKIPVRDKDGNTFSVLKDDPRYIAGELKHVTCGLFQVKDKQGNIFTTTRSDPLYISGELISTQTGRKATEKTKKKLRESLANRPIKICPHCGFESNNAGNMTQYHFDNCKLKTNIKDNHE